MSTCAIETAFRGKKWRRNAVSIAHVDIQRVIIDEAGKWAACICITENEPRHSCQQCQEQRENYFPGFFLKKEEDYEIDIGVSCEDRQTVVNARALFIDMCKKELEQGQG